VLRRLRGFLAADGNSIGISTGEPCCSYSQAVTRLGDGACTGECRRCFLRASLLPIDRSQLSLPKDDGGGCVGETVARCVVFMRR